MPSYYQTASLSTFKAGGYNGFLNRGNASTALSGDSLVDAVRYESQHSSNVGHFSNPYIPVGSTPSQHFHITGNEAPRDPYKPGVTDPTAQYLWHGPSSSWSAYFPWVNQTALHPYDRGCHACQHRFHHDMRTRQRDREDMFFYLLFALLVLQILLLIK